MLSPEGIVFDFNHMYLDIDNNEIQYIFDIHSTASVFDSLHELSEIMISDVDHKDKVATQLAYKFFEITNDWRLPVDRSPFNPIKKRKKLSNGY